MPGIEITPEQLETASQTMNTKSSLIDDQIAALRTVVSEISTFWKGSAHNSFEAVYQEWETSFKNMNEALKKISQNAHTAAENYSQAEASNTFR